MCFIWKKKIKQLETNLCRCFISCLYMYLSMLNIKLLREGDPSQDLGFQRHVSWPFFYVYWLELRGDCWNLCNCWPSLLKLSFHTCTLISLSVYLVEIPNTIDGGILLVLVLVFSSPAVFRLTSCVALNSLFSGAVTKPFWTAALFRAMKSLSDCLSLRWNGSVVDDKDLGHPCKAKNRFNCRIQKKIELKLFHGNYSVNRLTKTTTTKTAA